MAMLKYFCNHFLII